MKIKIGEKKAGRRSTRSENLNETQKLEFDAKQKFLQSEKRKLLEIQHLFCEFAEKNLSNQSR